MKNIDLRDIFIVIGLISIGVGLFFWFGLGVALTGFGVVLTPIALFGK